MSVVTVYGLKNCSTCIKAMKWLREHGIDYSFVDYRSNPISALLLEQWSIQLGGWEKLINRASTTWRTLPSERKSPASSAQWLALVAEFPALIKRPVMVSHKGPVTVGFSDKKPPIF